MSLCRVKAGTSASRAPPTLQKQVLDRLQSHFGRVSIERILSGDGLRNVHWALDPSLSEQLDDQPTGECHQQRGLAR